MFLRGGTSKGVFLNRAHLPGDRSQWDRIFLGIMGSPDPDYGRQLNGMGGGVSSLSKICVVGVPSEVRRSQGIDVEYTFVQVGIRDGVIDYSGNCGNLSSMIGAFAVDEGLCEAHLVDNNPSLGKVRTWNTNTRKLVDNTFPVAKVTDRTLPVLDLQQASIAGVPGKASQITLDFVRPGGARTGRLLPSGNPTDGIQLSNGESIKTVEASLVDATNPTVFLSSDGLTDFLGVQTGSAIDFTHGPTLDALERIRQSAAQRMGLEPAQAQPKIAVLSPPSSGDKDADVVIHALSMGVLHKAVPMTVGLCLGVAARVRNTVAWNILARHRDGSGDTGGDFLRIRHPSGVVEVGAKLEENGSVLSAKVIRTGRRLMKGAIWW
ncbi:hypothetical protein EVG20_g2815 [Dentipellis fragilis]|uniref:DUF453-domain-containing protein n=1 Tax=Dentipellis fragilis TaxID=205917 RepID=A0A4Y9Z7S9_9AGAM|nr:hypothetical protein EVG20_g2815 [Dentipellis fragilis]